MLVALVLLNTLVWHSSANKARSYFLDAGRDPSFLVYADLNRDSATSGSSACLINERRMQNLNYIDSLTR
jgi:hypothetical protein